MPSSPSKAHPGTIHHLKAWAAAQRATKALTELVGDTFPLAPLIAATPDSIAANVDLDRWLAPRCDDSPVVANVPKKVACGKLRIMRNQNGPYAAIRRLVEGIGGEMSYEPLPPGGIWTIVLHGRRLDVRVASNEINEIDGLYETPSPAPVVWKEYPQGERTPLCKDAFWRLIELMQRRGRPA